MPKTSDPDLSLFLDILRQLEILEIPYVIIGGFAAALYGITRATYDIDILVDLNAAHIQALSEAYPLPRYYADPYQMRRAMDMGSLFNIIDTDRGEKADLSPSRWTSAIALRLSIGCVNVSSCQDTSPLRCGSPDRKMSLWAN